MASTQPVVAAKVKPPTLPVGAVRRDALGLLDGLFDVPVTLVTGPAGFGKSWLLADWLRRNPQTPRAWVTLDDADADVMRLWTHIVEAVGRSEVPDVAKHAQALIQEHTDLGWPLIVDALAAGMDSERGHLVLVLDDAAGEAVVLGLEGLAVQAVGAHAAALGPAWPFRHRWRDTG